MTNMKQRLIVSLIVLPGVVAIVIPAVILYATRGAGFLTSLTLNVLFVIPGWPILSMGLYLASRSMSLFAIIGKGTLAPWDPPKKLVIQGVYRRVRNPMITGVLCVLLAEAMLYESLPLLIWFSVFLVANLVWIPMMEEPALQRRFGEDYENYKRNVPRWIPRLQPWDPS